MRRHLIGVLFAFLLSAGAAYGQSTTVSATITDSGSQVWANGTYQISFQPNASSPGGPYFWNGSPFNTATIFTGSLDGSGSFSISIPSNSSIGPAGTAWKFTVCPAATSPCFTSQPVAIAGASEDVSAAVIPPAIAINATNAAGIRAYSDAEVIGSPAGQIYWNLTSSGLRVWNGSAWEDVGGGSGGGISGTVSSPFVTVGVGPDEVGNSAFQYNPTSSGAPCNVIGNGPCFYADDTNGTIVLSAEGMGLFFDGFPGTTSIQPGDISIGDISTGTQIFAINNGHMLLGANGVVGGSLTLNGATAGSVGLAPGDSDSSLVMTQGGLNTFNFLTDPMVTGLCQYSGNANCITEKFTVEGSGAAFEIGESGATFVDCQSDSCPVGESFQTTYGDEGQDTKMAGGLESMSILTGGDGSDAVINLGENGVVGRITFGPVVVGSLPTASDVPGSTMVVSDSTAVIAEGQTCAGSGMATALAFSNGSIWKCF